MLQAITQKLLCDYSFNKKNRNEAQTGLYYTYGILIISNIDQTHQSGCLLSSVQGDLQFGGAQ